MTTEFMTAADVARALSVSRDFVHDHAAELGGIKLSTAPSAPLRFDPAAVREWVDRHRVTVTA